MVSSDCQALRTVRPYTRTISATGNPRNRPPSIAATRMLVPVAERMLKENTAGSGVGATTTGATRTTTLSSPGTWICGAYTWFNHAFDFGSPVVKTRTQRIIQGIHARTVPDPAAGFEAARCSSGRNTFTNAATHPMHTTPDTTSTSTGPK